MGIQCKKKCIAKCEDLQCDLCAAWLHASCEGLKKTSINC